MVIAPSSLRVSEEKFQTQGTRMEFTRVSWRHCSILIILNVSNNTMLLNIKKKSKYITFVGNNSDFWLRQGNRMNSS